MRNKAAILTTLLSLISIVTFAQMWNGTDTLYGNEWIDYDRQYFKVLVAQDGVYRLGFDQLSAAGIPVASLNAGQYQLFHLGEEAPLYTSTAGPLAPGDYLEFYGQKNRSELDRYLFRNPDEEMLNPYYSLFTDTAAYFLTWAEAGEPTLRYAEVENDLGEAPEKEEWYWGVSNKVFTETFNRVAEKILTVNGSGQTQVLPLYLSQFEGDGFSSELTLTQSFSIPVNFPYLDGPAAGLELRLLSDVNLAGHHLQVLIEGNTETDEEFEGSQVLTFFYSPNIQQAGNSVNIQVKGVNINDRYAVGFAKLRYPKTFNANGSAFFSFELEASLSEKYVEVENFSSASDPVVYDISNRLRLLPIWEGGKVKFKLPPSEENREIVIVNSSSVSGGFSIAPVSFVDYRNTNADYIIISHPSLFNDGQGNDWVAEYAAYRTSAQGGNFSTLVVEIQQLYDQFSYGINRHSISIRNFIHFAVLNWEDPRYIFIIGKGREYVNMRSTQQVQANNGANFFVPTFGAHGSDNLLAASNDSDLPVLPVGRIAATTPNEVRIYLNKVKSVENNQYNPQTVEDRQWIKRGLHLGGGTSAPERQQIKENLQSMARILEENSFGARIDGLYKASAEPNQNAQIDGVFQLINRGVSLITILGHSSPGTLDFNIDNPDNYDNFGKYPIMVSLGCYSGDIFTDFETKSESFVFYEDKAAVGFAASKGLGEVGALTQFARELYRNIGEDHYGESIGIALRATVDELKESTVPSLISLRQQFIFHGDPALKLLLNPGPDYVVDQRSVYFDPEVVSIQADSFSMGFEVANLGRNMSDSISIQIRQQLPDGAIIDLMNKRIPAPAFSSPVKLNLPTSGKPSIGLNTIFVALDPEDELTELPAPDAELNNELYRISGEKGISVFMVDNSAQPVFPDEFSIVGQQDLTLVAYSLDALAPERKYILELDTTALFNSLVKRRTEVIQTGGLIKWNVMLPGEEEQVFYWRITPDSTDSEVGYIWEERSFTYLPDSEPGWNQGHYYQFLENDLNTIDINEENRKFRFLSEGISIRIENKKWNTDPRPGLYYDYGGAAGSVRPWLFLNKGLAVVVSHPRSASFWKNPPSGSPFQAGDYGVATGGSRVFAFPTATLEERANLMEFLEEVIPEAYYVFVFSLQQNENDSYNPEEWAADSLTLDRNLFDVLEAEGAGLVRQLAQTGSVPYVLTYQKGRGLIDEDIAGSADGEVNIEVFIPRYFDYGNLFSTPIGPASSWQHLDWSVAELDPSSDRAYLAVYGIDEQENEALLIEELTSFDTSLAFIDASVYPYLKLQFNASDATDLTAAQLDHWRITYEGFPEIAVNPNAYFDQFQDTLQAGEQYSMKVAVENLSSYDMDSLEVSYTLTDGANQSQDYFLRFAPLPAGDTVHTLFQTSTASLAGRIQLLQEVNPLRVPKERTYLNNFLNLGFLVEKDKKNPILDVTFDGVHILNRDIVSPSPHIVITLEDENPYFPLEDEAVFSIKLIDQDGISTNLVPDGETVIFQPADLNKNNRATIEWQPTFTEDGIYKLVVQGRDVSGNFSGEHDYEMEFEVITKKMISNVLTYPNPFSTSTQFVYTLTGEPPVFFKIQIMNVSGRIVKEITQDEIGPLKIGTHRTDYVWDGTDDFGDRLANGIYLYRIIAKDMNGEDFDSYTNGTDRFFKNGLGKLVILR